MCKKVFDEYGVSNRVTYLTVDTLSIPESLENQNSFYFVLDHQASHKVILIKIYIFKVLKVNYLKKKKKYFLNFVHNFSA